MTKHFRQPDSMEGGERFDALEHLGGPDDDMEWFKDALIQMGRRGGASSLSSGAVMGDESAELDAANGVKYREVIPEITVINGEIQN